MDLNKVTPTTFDPLTNLEATTKSFFSNSLFSLSIKFIGCVLSLSKVITLSFAFAIFLIF